MLGRNWVLEQRTKFVQYRALRRVYRQEVWAWTSQTVRAYLRRSSLLLAGLFAAAGAGVYVVWEAAHSMAVDGVGVLLAAVIPPGVWLIGTCVVARWRAPAYVLDKYKPFYDSQHGLLFAAPVEMRPDGRVTLRLVARREPVEVTSVSCMVMLPDYECRCDEERQPGSVTKGNAVEFTYPDDFKNPTWPLKPGRYRINWDIRTLSSQIGQGGEIRIPRWRWQH